MCMESSSVHFLVVASQDHCSTFRVCLALPNVLIFIVLFIYMGYFRKLNVNVEAVLDKLLHDDSVSCAVKGALHAECFAIVILRVHIRPRY